MPDDDFRKAEYPSYEDTPCSPEVPTTFRGIEIRVPGKVRIPAEGPLELWPDAPWLPVCGVVRVPYDESEVLDVNPIKGVVLVFVDRATGKPISFNLRPNKDEVARAPNPPRDEIVLDADTEVRTDYVFSVYFNIDAFMFRPNFPRRSARYDVHALLGKWRARSVAVEVQAY